MCHRDQSSHRKSMETNAGVVPIQLQPPPRYTYSRRWPLFFYQDHVVDSGISTPPSIQGEGRVYSRLLSDCWTWSILIASYIILQTFCQVNPPISATPSCLSDTTYQGKAARQYHLRGSNHDNDEHQPPPSLHLLTPLQYLQPHTPNNEHLSNPRRPLPPSQHIHPPTQNPTIEIMSGYIIQDTSALLGRVCDEVYRPLDGAL